MPLGPYYLVWDNMGNPALLAEGARNWPYQVAEVNLVTLSDTALLPDGLDARFHEGAALAKSHCLNCHMVNGYGGEKFEGNLAEIAKDYEEAEFVSLVLAPGCQRWRRQRCRRSHRPPCRRRARSVSRRRRSLRLPHSPAVSTMHLGSTALNVVTPRRREKALSSGSDESPARILRYCRASYRRLCEIGFSVEQTQPPRAADNADEVKRKTLNSLSHRTVCATHSNSSLAQVFRNNDEQP